FASFHTRRSSDLKIWVLVEESTNWDFFKKPSNEPGMPTFMGRYFPMFQIFAFGGHQVVEYYGVGAHRLFFGHLFEVLQGLIGDVFALFEGNVHPVQKFHLVP